MHIKAIETLAKSSKANVYLLTHRQNQGLEFLLPWVKKIFYFDRELVQRSQKEAFLPLDSGFKHTMKLISELNEIKFQTIYNFTNTKISALLTSLVNAKTKIGLNNNSLQYFVNDPSRWIHYLNNTEDSKFHMIDIFRNSILEDQFAKTLALTETRVTKEKAICIQALTSDQKKNWPLKNWNQLIKCLSERLPDYKIYILCSNAEKTKLFDAFKDNIGNIFVSTYKQAFDMINTSLLLITGDTSIKHLASFTNTRVLELALGSAKPNETGVYSKTGYLLYNPLSCQPCKHSSNCAYSFVCQSTISVQDVLDSVAFILRESGFAPRTLFKAAFNQNALLSYEPASGIGSLSQDSIPAIMR
jgi:ADP-heptose:LPS heptosyltransferase